MNDPNDRPDPLRPQEPPIPGGALTEPIDMGKKEPAAEQAAEEQREKLDDIDERLHHLDEVIAAAQKKADEATHSHGLLGVGGTWTR